MLFPRSPTLERARSLAFSGVLLAGLCVSRPILAQEVNEERWMLRWVAPASCPTEASVLERVGTLTGVSAGNWRGRVRLQVEATVEENGSQWRAHLRTRAGNTRSERTLSAANCRALASATAVLLAWMLDDERDSPQVNNTSSARTLREAVTRPPHRMRSIPVVVPHELPELTVTVPPEPIALPPLQVPDPPVSQPEPPSTPSGTRRVRRTIRPVPPITIRVEPPSVPRPQTPEPQPEPRRFHFAIGLGGAFEYGTLPGLAGSLHAHASLRGTRWRVEAGISWRPGVRAFVPGDMVAGGALWALSFVGAGCYEAPTGPLELGICGSFEAGGVDATGFGVTNPGRSTEPWLLLRSDGVIRVPLGSWFAINTSIGAEFPLLRPNFVLEGVGIVHQASPVAFRGGTGIEVRF